MLGLIEGNFLGFNNSAAELVSRARDRPSFVLAYKNAAGVGF